MESTAHQNLFASTEMAGTAANHSRWRGMIVTGSRATRDEPGPPGRGRIVLHCDAWLETIM